MKENILNASAVKDSNQDVQFRKLGSVASNEKKNKSILKPTANGSLSIDAKDLFSNEKVIETLKQLQKSTIYKQIIKYEEKKRRNS